ncbi:MAG TPA: DMT family transporter [Sphingopyxis sp.]|nr:DMT family transporter [Sphingopyxis sp.]
MNQGRIQAILPTSAFVLLWSSGAIFSEFGLRNGSPFALLLLRYGIAMILLLAAAAYHRQLIPAAGTRGRVMLIGALIAGGYTICYLLAMTHGVAPGILATIMGVQPILTIMLTEKRASFWRITGLLCSFAGLFLIVNDGLSHSRFELLGLFFACMALLGITLGSIIQKRETQAPWVVLPLQYSVALAMILAITPFVPLETNWSMTFIISGLWLGLIISVVATFLLYHLISKGNLVNVTSLFYLVPGVTAALDWMILGNPMSLHAIGGLALVMAGLILVFRKS